MVTFHLLSNIELFLYCVCPLFPQVIQITKKLRLPSTLVGTLRLNIITKIKIFLYFIYLFSFIMKCINVTDINQVIKSIKH